MDFRLILPAFLLGVISAAAVTGFSHEADFTTVSPTSLEKREGREVPELPDAIRKELEDTQRRNRRFALHYTPMDDGKEDSSVATTGKNEIALLHTAFACSSSTHCDASSEAESPALSVSFLRRTVMKASTSDRLSENGSFHHMLSMLVDNDRKIQTGKEKKKRKKDAPTMRTPYALVDSASSPPNTIMTHPVESAIPHPLTA